LAARELVRVAVQLAARETHASQDVDDFGPDGLCTELAAVRPQRLADDIADGHARVQGRERILEHDLKVALDGA
jgi:hypothetical protein